MPPGIPNVFYYKPHARSLRLIRFEENLLENQWTENHSHFFVFVRLISNFDRIKPLTIKSKEKKYIYNSEYFESKMLFQFSILFIKSKFFHATIFKSKIFVPSWNYSGLTDTPILFRIHANDGIVFCTRIQFLPSFHSVLFSILE